MKILSLALALASLNSFATDRLYYPDNLKLNTTTPSADEVKAAVADFVAAKGISSDLSGLSLTEVQDSLLDTHFRYEQLIEGIVVADAELVVSVTPQGQISKIYTTLIPSEISKSRRATSPLISIDQAIEAAFQELKVDGVLLDAPKAKLVFAQDKGMKLVYDLALSVSAPYGHYAIRIDAMNGNVVDVKNAALERVRNTPLTYKMRKVLKPVSYKDALKKYNAAQSAVRSEGEPVLANGTANVFDPNPVVTLGRTDLQDTTAASVFLPAYRTVELLDLSLVNGVYNLKGPKVTLIDFESPNKAPSTSTNGVWDKNRGDVTFNDAMTYFHLDKSIRYLESLGFIEAKQIFPKSVEVDANGVSGQDNSHYIPSSRRLAFGHGCVDDNEDSDVILHELGHAIHHHINKSWSGGDTGAMGEGFGDYWAASYSVETEKGLDTKPEWVFKWDGHNSCWPGRKLNALSMMYNPSTTYGAHSNVAGGISDELWSTPLFQAFLELYKSGVARADIDKIVIEAHFGLGSGVKMRDMANAIIKTAKRLFPDKDYDLIYTKHFKNQKIVL